MEEQTRIESLVAEPAVEAFNEIILTWLAWSDEVQLYVLWYAKASIAQRQNSPPLSTVIDCGSPRTVARRSKRSTTLWPVGDTSAHNSAGIRE